MPIFDNNNNYNLIIILKQLWSKSLKLFKSSISVVLTDIEDLYFSNDATVNFSDVYRGLVSITKRRKTKSTDIEATYIDDSLYSKTVIGC